MIKPLKTERYTFRMTVQERRELDYACRCLDCDRTTLLRALINRLQGMEFRDDELIPLPIGMAAAGSAVASAHGKRGMSSRWGSKKKNRRPKAKASKGAKGKRKARKAK
jgi:hypothetical protein